MLRNLSHFFLPGAHELDLFEAASPKGHRAERLGLDKKGFLWLGAVSVCLPRKDAQGLASQLGGAL